MNRNPLTLGIVPAGIWTAYITLVFYLFRAKPYGWDIHTRRTCSYRAAIGQRVRKSNRYCTEYKHYLSLGGYFRSRVSIFAWVLKFARIAAVGCVYDTRCLSRLLRGKRAAFRALRLFPAPDCLATTDFYTASMAVSSNRSMAMAISRQIENSTRDNKQEQQQQAPAPERLG